MYICFEKWHGQITKTGLDVLKKLNHSHFLQTGDSEITNRIAAYELAFRMQMAAPELIDLSGETRKTIEAYGADRPEPKNRNYRGYTPRAHSSFARNCLLARRLVERGVRFINLYHASWDHHDAVDKDLIYNCSIVDQPIAALIKDLKQRGLLDSTLIVFAGEFGRTTMKAGGRILVAIITPLHSASGWPEVASRVDRWLGRPMNWAGLQLKTLSISTIFMQPCCICLAWTI